MYFIWRIIKLAAVFWPYCLVILVLVLVSSLLSLVGPLITKDAIDLIQNGLQTGENHLQSLIWLSALLITVEVVMTLSKSLVDYLGEILQRKMETFLSVKFYQKILSLEVGYFDTKLTGKILSKLYRSLNHISVFIGQLLSNILPFLLVVILNIILIAFYSWTLALLLVILFPLYIVLSEKGSQAWIRDQEVINQVEDSVFGRVAEVLSSIRVVKSFLQHQTEQDFFLAQRQEIENLGQAQSRKFYQFDVARGLVLNVVLLLAYVYIAYNLYLGGLSFAEFVLLTRLIGQVRSSLYELSFVVAQIQRARAGSTDFFETMAIEPKITDKPGAVELVVSQGRIVFQAVSFGYNQNQKVLRDISFTVEPGQKLAIIGESGEGKSTIVNLLLRYYEPDSGQILIDDQNIMDVTQDSLRRNIAVVLQDSILFSGTIRENVSYGKSGASDEEILQALKIANAEDFVNKFEKGLDTTIGERGVKLSGGQKQRISIARAVLKNAPILILDEATSSLDSKAEREVQVALERLMHNKTTIIIAHRLATIKNADFIIVLKNGQILEQGSPDELYQRNGVYTELVNLQNLSAIRQVDSLTLNEFNLTGS